MHKSNGDTLELKLHLINDNQDHSHNSSSDWSSDSKAGKENSTGTGRNLRTVRILVADDYDLVRRGLRALLEMQAGWEVVAEARNGREAADEAARLRPDIVILDAIMPVMNGLDAARAISKAVPNTRILLLINFHTEEMIETARHAGVHGYLLKSDTEADLVATIKVLIEGRRFYSSASSGPILHRVQSGVEERSRPSLTIREQEVLRLLAEGKSNKEVANVLAISMRTVENHRANIMEKLGLGSFSELMRYAVRNGFIDP